MGADLRLEQIAEHVDAGAHFGDAGRVSACSAVGELPIETIGAACPAARSRSAARTTPDAFGLGDARHVGDAAAAIGVAGMGHHPGETPPKHARRSSSSSVVVGGDAAALFAGVDLDQRARRPWMRGDGARRSSGSSVITITCAPAAFSLATWSSFCGVMPTA